MRKQISFGDVEAATGILSGPVFFDLAPEKIDRSEGEWCIIHAGVDHFRLYYDWYGMDAGKELQVEIARTLKIPENTVYTYISRGKQQLKEVLSHGSVR